MNSIPRKIDLHQIRPQIGAFRFRQNAKRQGDDRPEMDRSVFPVAEMFAQFMNLGMAVMTGRDNISGAVVAMIWACFNRP